MTFDRNKAQRLQQLREEIAILEKQEHESLHALAEYLKKAGLLLNGQIPAPLDQATAPWVPTARSDVSAARLLATHADTLRDLLSPFDSGIRAPGCAE